MNVNEIKNLKNKNIIYFGNDFNTDNKTSSHHNVEVLKGLNRIFYIESPGMRNIRYDSHDVNRIIKKLKIFFKGVRKIEDNFYIYTLLLIPTKNKLLKKLSINISYYFLKQKLKKYNFTNIIVWTVLPHVEPIIQKLEKKLIVYYCTDDFSKMPDTDENYIRLVEEKLIKNADIVFVTSHQLMINKSKINKNIIYSPHFVDFHHFNNAFTKNFSRPPDLEEVPSPIIGFVGLIEHWFDFELLNYLAIKNPKLSFVLIGRLAVDYKPKSKNIYILGKKKYDELPQYLKYFNVCIIPFKVNELTRSVNPLKLKEYLATGKPVVSTFMPELEIYKKYIHIAKVNDKEDFNKKVHFCLKNDTITQIRKRIELVRNDSWENKIIFFDKIIEEYKLKRI